MLACDGDDDEGLCDRGVQLMLQLIAMLLVGRALSHSSICCVTTLIFIEYPYWILDKTAITEQGVGLWFFKGAVSDAQQITVSGTNTTPNTHMKII